MKGLLKGLVLAIMVIAAPVSAAVVDNSDTATPDFFSTVGTWPTSTHSPGFEGTNYQFRSAGDGSQTATWTFDIDQAGQYEVEANWTSHSNRAPDAPYTIRNNGIALETVPVDQRVNGGQFVLLGTYTLEVGTLEVELTNQATGYVIADAVEVIFLPPPSPGGGGGAILWARHNVDNLEPLISTKLFAFGGNSVTGIEAGEVPFPRAGTIRNLYVKKTLEQCSSIGTTDLCSDSNKSATITLLLNGQPTDLTLVHNGAVGDVLSNTEDSVAVSAGDEVTFRIEANFPGIPPTIFQDYTVTALFQ